jgi:hypothetical protein
VNGGEKSHTLPPITSYANYNAMNWMPFFWLAATLGLLLLVERWIHRHLQGVMLLLTGSPEMAVVLYALPLLPGIFLHELSHAMAAVLLGVHVDGISIGPKLTGQRIQLGFVPVDDTDTVRSSLIGLAPLLVGCATILLIGYTVFDIGSLGDAIAMADWPSALGSLVAMLQAPDVWIWAYIIFTVSNTMLPSQADRQSWPPVVLFLVFLLALIWIAGLGPIVLASLAPPLTIGLHWLALMCTLTLIIDLPFVLGITLSEKALEQIKGWTVNYQE